MQKCVNRGSLQVRRVGEKSFHLCCMQEKGLVRKEGIRTHEAASVGDRKMSVYES